MKHFFCILSLMCFLCSPVVLAQGDDVIITNYEEFVEFRDAHSGTPIEVNNLTIKNVVYEGENAEGDSPMDALMATLTEAVTVVNGTFTLENLAITNLHFFQNIEFKGGFHFKDLPDLIWIQAFSGDGSGNGQDGTPTRTYVNGDFIIENCPQIAFPNIDGWRSSLWFGAFERVEGDFVIDTFDGELTYNTAANLTYVGGDFIIKNPVRLNDKNSWEMGFRSLRTVGGDLIVDGNMAHRMVKDEFGNEVEDYIAWWSLNFLGSLESVGGNVRIVNIPKMGVAGQGDYPFGYCTVKYLAELGVMNVCKKIEIGYTEPYGELIDLDELGSCSDGVTVGNPIPLDRSFCESGIALQHTDGQLANVLVDDNVVTIVCSEEIKEGIVYDMTGTVVKKFFHKQVDIEELPRGIYMIKLTTTNNHVGGYKIMK